MSTPHSPIVRAVTALSPAQVTAARAVVDAATRADGATPLDEDGRIGLSVDTTDRLHLLAELGMTPGQPAGYAHLGSLSAGLSANADTNADASDAGTPEPGTPSPGACEASPAMLGVPTDGVEPSGELVVHPRARRRGVGRALLRRLVVAAHGRPIRIWSHGDHPGASGLASAEGFTVVRRLVHMRAALTQSGTQSDGDLAPRPPAGVRLRTFRPGMDEGAWLDLNAAAFAGHPEQGRWTATDLERRMNEPWFDPDGFFLAEREDDGALLGFHWTKAASDPVTGATEGEVYVLGVHPGAHGGGLGKALALRGLAHLRALGLSTVTLYVEGDNSAAFGLYATLGFTADAQHVMYRSPISTGSSGAPGVSASDGG